MVQDLPPRVVRDAFRSARRPLDDDELDRLQGFGEFTRTELERVAYEVDRWARPQLRQGEPSAGKGSEIVLAPDHARVLDRLFASGIAVGPVTGQHDWPYTFALMHEVADVGCLCSVTVTLATAFCLDKWGSAPLKERYLPRVVENGGRGQGATWATEEQGGSDLGSNRTLARPGPAGRWTLSGEKFFCSNVGASFAVITARPDGAAEGIRGIRLFFAPAWRSDGRPNWRIRRLKDKLGTIPVPTGEVILEETEAYELGTPEVGVIPVMEMLNLSRVANAVGSAAVVQRAAELAVDYARVRRAFGKPLAAHPLLALDLATLATEADAASLLALDGAFQFGRAARDSPPYHAGTHLMRFTTHVAKLVIAEQAVRSATLAMEVLGGVGYLEERPVAKLVRDALVTPIWEGGANIQSLDGREVVRRHHPERRWRAEAEKAGTRATSETIRRFLATRLDAAEALGEEVDAKSMIRSWGEIRQMTLLADRARGVRAPDAYRARAELFAHLRSAPSSVAIPAALVEGAVDTTVPAP